MFTNKAIAKLRDWACAAQEGNGALAKQHLEEFSHLGASLLASAEFQQHCQDLYGHGFAPDDAECACKLLDAVASTEVHQVEVYGQAIP